jgi:hypothetical protein
VFSPFFRHFRHFPFLSHFFHCVERALLSSLLTFGGFLSVSFQHFKYYQKVGQSKKWSDMAPNHRVYGIKGNTVISLAVAR